MSLATWHTKKETAELLNVSEKTVERLAAGKQIERRMRTRIGGSPVAVYNPDDIRRIVAERLGEDSPRDPDVVLSPDKTLTAPATVTPETTAVVPFDPKRFAEELGAAIAAAMPEPLEPAHLLTIKAAMRLGYSREFLQELIDAGKLRKFGGKRWKLSRFELEDAIRPKPRGADDADDFISRYVQQNPSLA